MTRPPGNPSLEAQPPKTSLPKTRVLLLTSGTRGDVQPFVALGRGLLRAGYAVRLCSHARFGGFVETHGLEYAPVNDGLLELTTDGRALTEGRGNVLAAVRALQPTFARTLGDAARAAEGCNLIVYHPKAMAGPSLAEAHGVPGVLSLPLPSLTPTRAFALPLLGERDLGEVLNRASYAPLHASSAAYYGELRRWRAALGLPRPARFAAPHRDAAGRDVPTLYPASPSVVPPPTDWPATTWMTGYWFSEDDEKPDGALAAFVDAGPPPVVIGFSSMVGRDAAGRTRMVVDAVKEASVRAVLVSGWGGLAESALQHVPEQIFVTPVAPFAWLFRRTAAVVRHGGAGTTAEGLRAGVPALVCPFFGDQPYWGARVHSLSVGPRPIPQKRLSTPRLAAAIAEMIRDEGMRKRAQTLGAAIRTERGVETAVAFLKRLKTP